MSDKTVLIVEDNLINLQLTQVLLKKKNYHVLSATNSTEALSILKHNHPDLILMDIQLPDIDGIQLTEYLKTNSLTKDIIIVMLTAFAMKEDRVKAEKAGCDAYITKPFDPDLLTETMATLLRRRTSN